MAKQKVARSQQPLAAAEVASGSGATRGVSSNVSGAACREAQTRDETPRRDEGPPRPPAVEVWDVSQRFTGHVQPAALASWQTTPLASAIEYSVTSREQMR